MVSQIDGPRIAPRGGRADALVVFLHGYGADGNDLIEIGRIWQDVVPGAAFVAPHAPAPCAEAPVGRQWFSLRSRDPHEMWAGVSTAGPGLEAFLAEELQRHGLPGSRLALVGFSQGTMVALHVGLRRPEPPAALVGYSGMLVGPEHLAEGVAAPPILLLHGDADEVIPADALFISAQGLARASIPVQWHLAPGLGHGIDEDGLRLGAMFLAETLRPRPGGIVR
jgi:phospholipase/carboxylesterase